MDPRTGEIHQFPTDEAATAAGYIPINRDLTERERADQQIRLYSPCGCGSGRKFKFCCKVAR